METYNDKLSLIQKMQSAQENKIKRVVINVKDCGFG